MARTRRRYYILCILSLLLACYLASYVYLRDEHYIIHRAGYTGQTVANHWVEQGENMRALHPLVATAIGLIYSPAMGVEWLYWQIAEPEGSPWSY